MGEPRGGMLGARCRGEEGRGEQVSSGWQTRGRCRAAFIAPLARFRQGGGPGARAAGERKQRGAPAAWGGLLESSPLAPTPQASLLAAGEGAKPPHRSLSAPLDVFSWKFLLPSLCGSSSSPSLRSWLCLTPLRITCLVRGSSGREEKKKKKKPSKTNAIFV